MDTKTLWREVKNFGVMRTSYDLAVKLMNRAVYFKVLRGILISRVSPAFLAEDPRYKYGFLDEPTLLRFAADPQYELSAEFIRDAVAKGDKCYGILDGEVLAAYGWYSRRPTVTDLGGMILCFDDCLVYMYKGFTHHDYRGQRLHAVGMTKALERYLSEGFSGVISYVESNNFSSLKSCYRMGYMDFGKVYIVRIFGRYYSHSDSGCDKYGFRLSSPALRLPGLPLQISG